LGVNWLCIVKKGHPRRWQNHEYGDGTERKAKAKAILGYTRAKISSFKCEEGGSVGGE
jgi:hypothetical protein